MRSLTGDPSVKAAAAILAIVAVACCVHGIASVSPTRDAAILDVTGGVGVPADPTLCRLIAFAPNPPFHPDTALEPHISAKTVDHHYRAHQKGYVMKLNAWIAATPQHGVPFPLDRSGASVVSDLIRETDLGTPVNNLASQIFNHALYFAALRGPDGRAHNPDTPLGQAILASFGSFAVFQASFAAKSVAHFGSGWVWLVHNKSAASGQPSLSIVDTHDAAAPIVKARQHQRTSGEAVAQLDDIVPLIVCDVWEHAYYLDRQQKRDAYVEAWFRVVDWGFAEARFKGSQVEYAGDGSYPNFFPPTFAR